MDISSINGTNSASLVESLYGESAKAKQQEEEGNASPWGMDSIFISTAAREKMAAETTALPEESDGQGQTGAGGAGGGSSNNNDSKLQSLKSKLSSLQSSLSQANGSDASSISAQISQLMGEIAALESGGA